MAYQGHYNSAPLYDSTVQQAPGAYPWGPTQSTWGTNQTDPSQTTGQAYNYNPTSYGNQASYGPYPGTGDGSNQCYGQYQNGSGYSDGSQFQAYDYNGNQQAWTQDQQQWGWDQAGAAVMPPANSRGGYNGPPNMGRGARGGGAAPPAFGSGRGGGGPPVSNSGRCRGEMPAFGGGRGGGDVPAFGSGRGGGGPPIPGSGQGRGEKPALGGGRGGGDMPPFGGGRGGGGPPAFGRGRGGGGPPPSNSGRGRGDKPAFGSGRGGGGPPAFGGGRGGGGPNVGRGRGEKPAFGSGRGGGGPPKPNSGRGRSDKPAFGSGRGGGGPPAIGGGRGGKGPDRGRGRETSVGASRGRGGGPDRGRGGGGAGRGKGFERAEPEEHKEHMTVADTGVGISSIGDLIKSAQARRLQGMTQRLNPDAPMEQFVECWKNFARGFVDCGNSISNLECSLKASKLDLLTLRSDTDLLIKIGLHYNIFTSTLILVKKCSAWDANELESIFLARGLGLNKKAAKLDCYTKAYKLLMDNTVVEIMSQEDTDENSLKQEVNILFKENPQGFMELLKKSEGISSSVDTTPIAKRKASSGGHDGGGGGGGPAKRPRPLMPDDFDGTSLVPKKKQGILMERTAPLVTKLAKLKELLKVEGITKLHIVPKIDQFAHKTAINIRNVYKFIEPPSLGFESKTPVYCEIYFDDTFVAASKPNIRRNSSMHEAYCNFTDILCSETVERIANNPKKWSVAMESMRDICNVVTKCQGQDNDGLLTSNLANMKQMMASMPNLKYPVSKMVITEHETDKNIENVFKSLELSATRNLVLLECEILRNPELNFVCNISLQGKVMASRVHSVKNMAKRLASETVMEQLRKTNDYIFVAAEYKGQNLNKEELFKMAKEKQDAGVEVPQHVLKLVGKACTVKSPPEGMSREELKRFDDDIKSNQKIEDQPENVALQPLLPYLAMVIYDICDKYYETFSLEDIVLDGIGMTRSQREVIGMCANKMGMRINTKVRNKEHSSLLRRSVTAQDMSKILQVVGGSSGRYKLVKCQNKLSKAELDEFKTEFIANYEQLKTARETVEEEEEVEGLDIKQELVPAPQIAPSTTKIGATSKPQGPAPWENNEPLNFKGSAKTRAPGSSNAQSERAKVPPPGANVQPRPLLSAEVRPSQGLRGLRLPHPGPRFGGRF